VDAVVESASKVRRSGRARRSVEHEHVVGACPAFRRAPRRPPSPVGCIRDRAVRVATMSTATCAPSAPRREPVSSCLERFGPKRARARRLVPGCAVPLTHGTRTRSGRSRGKHADENRADDKWRSSWERALQPESVEQHPELLADPSEQRAPPRPGSLSRTPNDHVCQTLANGSTRREVPFASGPFQLFEQRGHRH